MTHRDSGFVFPARLGDFYRINPHQYDPAGRDVSIGYNNELAQAIATIYIYPTGGRTLDQEFIRCQAEVNGVHPGAKLLSRGSTTASPRKVRALTAEYTFSDNFAGRVQPLRSVLLVAQNGNYFVEYRLSYPASNEGTAAPVLRKLAQDYAWP